jgi:hypothetical protein
MRDLCSLVAPSGEKVQKNAASFQTWGREAAAVVSLGKAKVITPKGFGY